MVGGAVGDVGMVGTGEGFTGAPSLLGQSHVAFSGGGGIWAGRSAWFGVVSVVWVGGLE